MLCVSWFATWDVPSLDRWKILKCRDAFGGRGKRYVASVSDECYKSRSECCICCNGCIHMLQRSVTNVLSVFFRTHVATVFIIWMLHVLYECCIWLQWFSSVFRCFLVFSVSSAFRSMLQRLYLDVSKINWVLHLSSWPFAASSRYRKRRPLPLLSLGRRRPTWSARNRVQRADVCSDVRYFLPLISLRIYVS
jgi:hypothetical protein